MTGAAVTDIGFWNVARSAPERVAIIDGEGKAVTFGELLARSNRMAHGLRVLGLDPGDGVAVALGNEPAFLEVALATAQIGLYLTPVNVRLTGTEMAYIVNDCEAKAWVVGERAGDAARQAASQLRFPADAILAAGKLPRFRPLDDFLDLPDTLPKARIAGQTMLYTSGTTGRPKGVRRPLPGTDPETAARMTAGLAMLFGLIPGDGVHLTAAPLYHSAPLAFALAALHLGHTVVLVDRWEPLRTLELIEQHRVTSTLMVPTMFHRLLDLSPEDRSRFDLSSLSHVLHAGAPCPPHTKQRMLEWWGPVIYEFYAATEGGGTLVRPEEWLKRPGTVGRPWPGAVVKVLDDDGRECAAGEAGTVWIRSSVGDFEYHGDPAKTGAGRRDEFFTVGDVGYLDDDGWLFLSDRSDDVIVSGGVNIYPAEIEAVLLAHPAVADVAVFGVPNAEWGEEVKAAVQVLPGVDSGDGLAGDLLTWCEDRLARFKRPRTIDFHSELPRQETGKLARRLLRDPEWAGQDRRI
jgi:long-chain acyl-CoA synthetase